MSVDVENLVTFEAPTGEAAARVELARPVLRFCGNPILTSHDVNRVWEPPALKVKTVHNAGIAEYRGEVLMLFRSHLRNGTSVLDDRRSSHTRIVPSALRRGTRFDQRKNRLANLR